MRLRVLAQHRIARRHQPSSMPRSRARRRAARCAQRTASPPPSARACACCAGAGVRRARAPAWRSSETPRTAPSRGRAPPPRSCHGGLSRRTPAGGQLHDIPAQRRCDIACQDTRRRPPRRHRRFAESASSPQRSGRTSRGRRCPHTRAVADGSRNNRLIVQRRWGWTVRPAGRATQVGGGAVFSVIVRCTAAAARRDARSRSTAVSRSTAAGSGVGSAVQS